MLRKPFCIVPPIPLGSDLSVFLGPPEIGRSSAAKKGSALVTAAAFRDYRGKEGGAREGESWKKNSS